MQTDFTAMLRDVLNKGTSNSTAGKDSVASGQADQKLDGEEFNVINHSDAEESTENIESNHHRHHHEEEGGGGEEEEGEAEKDDGEPFFYRPGLAGLLGGRMMMQRGGAGGGGRNPPGKFDHLHPFTQVLSISNVEDCVQLESEAFPENERCSREKVWEWCLRISSTSIIFSISLQAHACFGVLPLESIGYNGCSCSLLLH